MLASCGARERVVRAVRVTRRCRLSPGVFLGSGVRMVTAGDGDALRESRVGYGLHRRAAWSPGAASLDG